MPENQTSIELFFFSNFTVFPYKSLKMHQSQVGVKKYLRRWTTSSTKIQVWTTFCLHPNLCKSISKLDHNLVFQSLSAQLQSMCTMCTDPGYLDTPSWNPDCWLGHVSNPRILPGNIKVYSWPTDDMSQLMIDEKLQLTPFPQYKVAPQSPHIETFACKWNW